MQHQENKGKTKARRNITANLNESVLSQKRVSNADKAVEVLDELFDYYDYFNSLTEDDSTVFQDSIKTLDQIPVLSEFSEFITPASVKLYAGNRRLPELLLRNDKKLINVAELGYSKYINLNDEFRSFFKKSGNESVVTLASLKTEVSLMDIISRIQVVDSVNYDSDPYIPIKVIDAVSVLINSQFLQDSASLMIKDFCAKIRF